jgi:hypothetical protein
MASLGGGEHLLGFVTSITAKPLAILYASDLRRREVCLTGPA